MHVEIETGNKKGFGLRMYRYYYRLFDRFKLPIVAMAIFAGRKGQRRIEEYKTGLFGTEVLYRYNTYQIFDHTDEELLAMDNPFALVVLAAKKSQLETEISDEELNEERLIIAKALIKSKKYNAEKTQRFLLF